MIVVCDEGDAHGTPVVVELEAVGKTVLRYNLSDVRSSNIVAHSGETYVEVAGSWYRITAGTTVWWHRTGVVDVSDLDAEESALAHDEAVHVLKGSFSAAGVRWVDDPSDVDRAELKLYQLSVASNLGIVIPLHELTNHTPTAELLASDRAIVAKALSSGEGIAPFVAEVMPNELALVAGLPVLLEELVSTAVADLRVVVIANKAYVWRRQRTRGVTDWRRDDPSGSGFSPTEDEATARDAVRLTAALRLSMSCLLYTSDAADE